MPKFEILLLLIFLCAFILHCTTIAIGLFRSRKIIKHDETIITWPAVSVIRPVCGLEPVEKITLETTFHLDYPNFEIIFCIEDQNDPAVAFIQDLIGHYSHVSARLLIGGCTTTLNPKLNNLFKGWSEASHEVIVLSDSNVLLPNDYLQQVLLTWQTDTGLVCSPPLGSKPQGFWAEVECAFLNSYQARWQLAADFVGYGFAQGKTMLWHRKDVDKEGGLQVLGRDIAEDAAATKLVRKTGKKVKLVDKPFEQLLGYRTASQVVMRQVRWARLRRATFPLYFIPEFFSGSLIPFLCLCYGLIEIEFLSRLDLLFVLIFVWFGLEAAYIKFTKWHYTWMSPIAWLCRDLILPFLWISAWAGNQFTWRGNLINMSNLKTECQDGGGCLAP